MEEERDYSEGFDSAERGAVDEFIRILEEQEVSPKPIVLWKRVHRTPEGQIVVPVSVSGSAPFLPLASLMEHKTEQIYRQTSCRVRLAQCPTDDPEKRLYVWGHSDWQTLP